MNIEIRRVLIVVAHPDDEVLGCGATMARMASKGLEIQVLILGEGAKARGGNSEDVARLKEESIEANRLLGVNDITWHDFPDNRFDTIPMLDIVKRIEAEIDRVDPDIIFTHYRGDLNIDHSITYKAVMTATRPLPSSMIKGIFSFEVLSSTEWSGESVSFRPNTYVDVSNTLDKKLLAMKAYNSELREVPHPRSIVGIKALAIKRGSETGVKFAEAFEMVRFILS